MVAAPLFASLIICHRSDDDGGIGTDIAAGETTARDQRAGTPGSREGRTLAVRDSRIQIERRLLTDQRPLERLFGADRTDRLVERLEIGPIGWLGKRRRIGRACELVGFAQLRELDGILDEEPLTRLAEIARIGRRNALAHHHAKTQRPRSGLLDELRFPHAHLDREVRPAARACLGNIRPRSTRTLDDRTPKLDQLRGLSLRSTHPPATWVPPTVIEAILIVGQPTPTGTDCPSLPQVQIPSET